MGIEDKLLLAVRILVSFAGPRPHRFVSAMIFSSFSEFSAVFRFTLESHLEFRCEAGAASAPLLNLTADFKRRELKTIGLSISVTVLKHFKQKSPLFSSKGHWLNF